MWEQYQRYIHQLNTVTGENYDEYNVTVRQSQHSSYNRSYVNLDEYRSKLSSLIRILHIKYFSQEESPFTSSPSMVVSQTQQQSQSQTMVLEVQSLLDEKLYTGDLDEKEKTFIEKIKEILPQIKSTIELLNVIASTAQQTGLDIHQLTKIFGY